MGKYEENVYNWLKRKGLAEKYEHAGIYCIKIDDKIVYIGKSQNMLKRVAQHYVGIHTCIDRKYRILAESRRKGHSINFDVLYRTEQTDYSKIANDIGEKEGEYIREYMPALNTQIPHEDDWRTFDVNKKAQSITLTEIINAA
jgi:hypothetical protein